MISGRSLKNDLQGKSCRYVLELESELGALKEAELVPGPQVRPAPGIAPRIHLHLLLAHTFAEGLLARTPKTRH